MLSSLYYDIWGKSADHFFLIVSIPDSSDNGFIRHLYDTIFRRRAWTIFVSSSWPFFDNDRSLAHLIPQ